MEKHQGKPNDFCPDQIFGNITIVSGPYTDKKRNRLFDCRCICGKIFRTRGTRIKRGLQSCGCLRNVTHGETLNATKEFRAWSHIKDRCNNPRNKSYADYGGKGIKICDRWLNSYEDFLSDVGRAPSPKHTIDRFPNNEGNYEPGNVRWSNWYEQQGNRTNNKWIEYNGEKMIQEDWARKLKIESSLFGYHIRKGRTIDQIIKICGNEYAPA